MAQAGARGGQRGEREALHVLPWVAVLDLAAKVLLLLAVVQIGLDPAWGNLEGKSPATRALTYPLLALVVPVAQLFRQQGRPYPWGTDLLVTLPAFSDILGNRLDLYDQISWFDDFMHAFNTGALGIAVVLVCGAGGATLARRVVLAVASAMTLSLGWEVWEYYAFVTRSVEAGTAYVDTVGDLALGWIGAVTGGVLMGIGRPSHAGAGPQNRPAPAPSAASANAGACNGRVRRRAEWRPVPPVPGPPTLGRMSVGSGSWNRQRLLPRTRRPPWTPSLKAPSSSASPDHDERRRHCSLLPSALDARTRRSSLCTRSVRRCRPLRPAS